MHRTSLPVHRAFEHGAASTPADHLVNTTDLHHYVTRSTGVGALRVDGGRLYAPDESGLGVRPDFDSLGDPIEVF